MFRFFNVKWQKIAIWRRFMLLLALVLLGASAAWVALADSTNYTDEDTHIEEALALLDLFSGSTNASVWLDTNTLSWAYYVRWGDPSFTDGAFVKTESSDLFASCYKINGEWLTNPPCWYVPSDWDGYKEGEHASLNIDLLDRARLTNDVVVLALTIFDNPGELRVDLVDTNSMSVTPDYLFENLLEGSNEVVQIALQLPLSIYSNAVGISIRRVSGETIVYNSLLYSPAQDGEAAWLSDSDAILSGEDGSPSEGTNATTGSQSDADQPVSDYDGTGAQEETLTRTETDAAAEEQGAEIVALTLQSANFTIPRSVLDGGGTRQTSTTFFVQDSIAQPSPIGLSTGSLVVLHAGYQQADEWIIPEILNVGVIPEEFNPSLGEIATLSYVLNVHSPSVTIEVWKDPITNTVVSAQYQLAGLNAISWLGTNENGTVVTPGPWTFTITAACNGQTTSTVAQVRVVNNIPVILSVHDEPDIFCPAQGAARIYYTTDEKNDKDLKVTISLEDAQGNPVTDITYIDQPVGIHTQLWDGTDTSNFGTGTNYQLNGLYIYRINALRQNKQANEKTGVIVLACNTVATNVDNIVELRYIPDSFKAEITRPTGSQLTDANFALITADPSLFRQSPIYKIKTTPTTIFYPPAILTFKYSTGIIGDIDEKLQIRRYDPAADEWVAISNQAVDYANNQVVAEITNLSFYALFSSELLIEMRACVRLEPESLKVNPGILTAFVSLPEGYPESGVVDATCDGAAYESMQLNQDGTEMVIKYRRQDIEEALAQQGEEIDTHFIVEVRWQGDTGTFVFQGEDDIKKIVD